MKQVSNAINSLAPSAARYHSLPQRKAFSKYLFVLLLAGFAIVGSSFQKENHISNLQKEKSVPFKGKFTLSHSGESGVVGFGNASHIGRFTFVSDNSTGKSVYTAANGDEIFTTYSVSTLDLTHYPMVEVTLQNNITGGTGRFERATGNFLITAFVDESVGQGDGTFEGEISY
jgi:hypothetical protein